MHDWHRTGQLGANVGVGRPQVPRLGLEVCTPARDQGVRCGVSWVRGFWEIKGGPDVLVVLVQKFRPDRALI